MTGKQPLMWDETIFQQPEIFELDYLPEVLHHRETQLNGIIANLRPALRGVSPNNAYCRGPPGTGKTSAVLKVFKEIEEKTSSVACVHVNCQLNSTRFGVFSKIFKALTGQEAPSSGVPFQKLYEKTAKVLTKENRVLVVALDDINYLFADREASEVVYSLLRMYENYPGTKVGIIAIISDLSVELAAKLDSRALSVFLAEEIAFNEYSAAELRDILAKRIELGFYPGVVSEEVLERVVELTARSHDLRVGINILKRAGLSAERRASHNVELEDVDYAFKYAKVLHIRQTLKSLSDDEKELLRCLAEVLEKGGCEEVMAGTLFEAYSSRVKRGYTSYYEMINRMEDRGMLTTQKSGDGQRGQSRLITLTYPAEDIILCLGSNIN